MIALTPTSEQVEGTSSLLWMLVLAAGARFFRSPDALLAWSKIAAGLAFGLSLYCFARLAKRFLPLSYAAVAVLLLALNEAPFLETLNGMEMNLYMLLTLALALALIDAYRPQTGKHAFVSWSGAVLLSCALLLVRLEAPYLLFFLYGGVWFTFRKAKSISLLALANVLFFAGVEAWRFHRFHSWLPNTILAKRWPPYTPLTLQGKLFSRTDATAEIFTILAIPICFAAAFWLVRKLERQTATPPIDKGLRPIFLSMTLGALGVGLALGQNWGHPGRMVLAFVPFLILALVSAMQSLSSALSLNTRRVMAVIVLCQLALWPVQVWRAVDGQSISYAAVEQTGLAADAVRLSLHRETLSAFIPDVGASSLCCQHLTVMDSALLANAYLARRGYSAVPTFVQNNHPDLIETHGPWAREGRFYRDHALDGYGLIQVLGKYFFLRNDLYADLKHAGGAVVLPSCVTPADIAGMRAEDVYFLTSRKECIRLNPSPAPR
ncbi:hypothetical protein [Terriglobus sp.]|uniref:hypothetical protein n=1 Tax=Terriglobus sp. TaxID=1889013 RepID=UPI003B0028A4